MSTRNTFKQHQVWIELYSRKQYRSFFSGGVYEKVCHHDTDTVNKVACHHNNLSFATIIHSSPQLWYVQVTNYIWICYINYEQWEQKDVLCISFLPILYHLSRVHFRLIKFRTFWNQAIFTMISILNFLICSRGLAFIKTKRS